MRSFFIKKKPPIPRDFFGIGRGGAKKGGLKCIVRFCFKYFGFKPKRLFVLIPKNKNGAGGKKKFRKK